MPPRKHARPAIIPAQRIERAILVVRGHKVLLDSDLAALYDVETKQLLRAVKRNIDRFPKTLRLYLRHKSLQS